MKVRLNPAEAATESTAAAQAVSRVDVGDATLKAPYNPRGVRTDIETAYGTGSINAATVPAANAKNVKLAGQRHPETGIVFNERGMPIFDDVAVFDTIIPRKFFDGGRALHMREATKLIRSHLEQSPIFRSMFTETQVKDILAGKAQIDSLTWHHHEQIGRMQLVPRDIHDATGHIGGKKHGRQSNI